VEELDKSATLKNIRISFYPESELLIAKIMPSIPHEGAHRQLGREIERDIEKWDLRLVTSTPWAERDILTN